MSGAAALETALVGQPRALTALRAALAAGPANAYLFVGPDGSGKREAARVFASELLAEGSPDPDGVRRRVIRDPSPHPDFVWVEPEGATHLVETIRAQVIRGAALRPSEGFRRVFVIDDAEAMRDESQNALLKTLEEPGEFAHFILLVRARELILPTIASRCSSVDFTPLPVDVLIERLRVERDERALAAARLSAGDIDLARLLLSESGSAIRSTSEAAARAALVDPQPPESWRGMLDLATEAGEAAAEAETERLLDLGEGSGRGGSKGKLRTDAASQVKRTARRHRTRLLDLQLRLCSAWFRDLAVICAGSDELVFNSDRVSELTADARGLSPGKAADAVALVNDTRRRLGLNASEDLALDALWLRIGSLLGNRSHT